MMSAFVVFFLVEDTLYITSYNQTSFLIKKYEKIFRTRYFNVGLMPDTLLFKSDRIRNHITLIPCYYQAVSEPTFHREISQKQNDKRQIIEIKGKFAGNVHVHSRHSIFCEEKRV